jgi:hypothetical protein
MKFRFKGKNNYEHEELAFAYFLQFNGKVNVSKHHPLRCDWLNVSGRWKWRKYDDLTWVVGLCALMNFRRIGADFDSIIAVLRLILNCNL